MELHKQPTHKQPIVVELENGIFKQRLYPEGVWSLIRAKPLNVLRVLYWHLNGELPAKVGRALNNTKLLPPVSEEIIDLLQAKRREGYPVILKHHRHRELAQTLQLQYGCFSDLTSHLSDQLVEGGFSFVSSSAYSTVWPKAREGFILGCNEDSRKLNNAYGLHVQVLKQRKSGRLGRDLFKALRPHQWLKSALVFVPLFLSNAYLNAGQWLTCLSVFLCFALVSSSTYVLNDLFDLEADRQHPVNKFRPFASGNLPLFLGPIAYFGLLGAGLLGAYYISASVFQALAAYSAIGHLYTFYLKRLAIIDMFILSLLYCGRIFTGALAIDASVSPWLYLCAAFFFLSLAHMKRVAELGLLKANELPKRRAYTKDDALPLLIFGIGSAFASTFFFPLFLWFGGFSERASAWVIEGIVLYWFAHIWLLTVRNRMASDPVKFALTDRLSQICFGTIIVLWLTAIA